MRVGVLVSHPIQYYSPWFRAIARSLELHVFYAHRPNAAQQGQDFGTHFQWDVDLLAGYAHTFLPNRAADPGTHHFFGCDTPEVHDVINAKQFEAFIVGGWFMKSYWQATFACRRAGIPVLVRGDSILDQRSSLLRRLQREVVHRIALRCFDGFLSVGQRNAEYLRHYGVPARRIFHTPHCVDNDWFASRADAERPRRSYHRQGWAAGDDTIVVLFAGKLIGKKRPGDLLRALRIAGDRVQDVIAVFAGAGELEPELRSLAATSGVRAQFIGFKNQSELPAIYASADVLVLPSDSRETWGLVVNEAMACGLPAIVSDAVGCAPDLIEEGRTGFTFPLGDAAVLAERIVQFATAKRAAVDFARPVRQRIQLYSVERAAAGLFNTVENVLRRA